MKRKVLLRITVYVALMLLAMFYGMVSVQFQLFPYSFLKTGHTRVKTMVLPEIPKEYLDTDVSALISIRQSKDVKQLRGELIAFLWGDNGLPSNFPLTVAIESIDNRYSDLINLSRLDKLNIKMEYGLKSHVYHFIPKRPNNRIILYHQGHRGDFYNGKKQIGEFLDNGYSVLAFSMPLSSPNNQPIIQLPKIGKLKLTSHDHMKFLSPENGHPIKYFIEPVVVALNYIEKNNSYSQVSMVGLSGGGWTTTLAAAVDTRIEVSFPVAGSYPIYLRSNSPRDWGEYEQNTPELYSTVNYLELYVLGAYGSGRKQLQVINKYDSCCFSGEKWGTYKDIVKKLVYELGAGEFDLFLDDSHDEHLISNMAMIRILDELGSINP